MSGDGSVGTRVRYSTIINYVGQLYWLLMSVLFTVIVTRRLSVVEYGLLSTMMGVFNIVVLAYGIWSFWVPRAYARGVYDTVSTAFTLNLLYIPLGAALMVVVGFVYNNILGYGFTVFALTSLLVVSESLNRYLRGVTVGSKPFIDGKVLIIRSTIRVLMAYVLVVVLLYRLVGAVSAIIISAFTASTTYYFLLKHYGVNIPRPRLSMRELRRIFRNSYIPLLTVFSGVMGYLERPLLTAVTASTMAAAYLGVSYIPRNIVFRSSQALSSGLTAKLLRKPNRVDVEDVLRITFILILGMNMLLLTLSTPVLSLFKREYVRAQVLFTLFVIESTIIAVSNIMASIAIATEKRDLYLEGPALASTPLFKIPFMRFVRNTISITCASAIVYVLIASGVEDAVLIALPYPLAWLATSIPFLYYTYREARKELEFSIPWRELFSSIIAGAIASSYLFLSGTTRLVIESFWRDTPLLLKNIGVGLAIYATVLYLLSPWTRFFVKKSLKYYLGGYTASRT